MSPLDLRRNHWNDRATRFSTDAERIDSSDRSQWARFSTIDAIVSRGGAVGPVFGCDRSVLDVGCGVGDLYRHLARLGDFEYVGVDLAPGMIARAREKYPGVRFDVANILEWKPEPCFDLVVGIGIHADPIPDAEDVLAQVLRQQFALCKVAAHVSLLSDRFDGFGPDTLRWSPTDVLTLAMKITPWVALRHDYLPHDFSVTLYRKQR